jgi:3-methylfumaryl-CoA hydratase
LPNRPLPLSTLAMTTDYSAWVGKTETATDTLDPARSNALRAALGDVAPQGEQLPLLHHWLYFWNVLPPQGLGPDGHPAKGGFLPPVPLPRRMWAGGRLQFLAPLHFGEVAHKTSTILKVEAKEGKSGQLVFVTVEHRLSGAHGDAIIEEQDLVYKEASPTGPSLPSADAPASKAQWQTEMNFDPVALFRYSALTMNGHRIHYDRPYAMNEEAYPALVVHGPLQATILAHFAQRHLGRGLKRFDFRGQSPAFDGLPLHICGEPKDVGAKLWTEQGGSTCMSASAD